MLSDLFDPPKPRQIDGPTRRHSLDRPEEKAPKPVKRPSPNPATLAERRAAFNARRKAERDRIKAERIAAGTYISPAEHIKRATAASAAARRTRTAQKRVNGEG